MNHKIFAVRDAKSEVFNKPFFSLTHGQAERDFKTAVNDPQTQLNKYPEDYDLWFVGEYDDTTGKLIPSDTPQHVVKAIQLVNSPQ